MSAQPADTSSKKPMFSVNLADGWVNKEGEQQTKFREIAVGFGNRKGGLSFQLPPGLSIGSGAEVVIFPIEPKQS